MSNGPAGAGNDPAIRRLMDQLAGRAQRNYSQGRLNKDDDGDIALAVGVDKAKGVVIIDFGKPVAWIGLGKEHLDVLIASLQAKRKELDA